MSVTTQVEEQPISGVTRDSHGTGWRVRITPFPSKSGFATVTEANEYARELHRRKRNGILVAPRSATLTYTLLREGAEAYLKELATVGGKSNRPYSDDSMKQARKDTRPWRGEDVPIWKRHGRVMVAPPAVDGRGKLFAEMPFAALDVTALEEYLAQRYVETPRAAVGEYQALLGILTLMRRRGEQFDPLLLDMRVLRRRQSKRVGLEWENLVFMSTFAHETQKRIYPLGGSLGGRIMELLQAEDAWLNLKAKTISFPSWVMKQRDDHVVYLLPEEVQLFREQQLVRSPLTRTGEYGTPLLFPRIHGGPWGYHGSFYNRVIQPTRRKAAAKWRELHGLPPIAPTPFEWIVRDDHGKPKLNDDGEPIIGGFAPHDLRRGAADLLLELGLEPDLVAARLGHKDDGVLLLKKYANRKKDTRLQLALDAIAADGGIDARLALVAAGRA